MAETELTAKQLQQLLAHFGTVLGDGKLLKSADYHDAAGEHRYSALIDRGIKGTPDYSASVHDIEHKAGKLPPTLEDLGEIELRAMANALGVTIVGRFNKGKIVVAIRKAMAAGGGPAAAGDTSVDEPTLPAAPAPPAADAAPERSAIEAELDRMGEELDAEKAATAAQDPQAATATAADEPPLAAADAAAEPGAGD